MNLRKTRRGFTIVELVIVVAVIGVLAAVLIPTFVNLTQKANKASDDSLVRNLNTALAMAEGDNAIYEGTPVSNHNDTMHDAVIDLEYEGYHLENLTTRTGEKLLWNIKTNRFCLEGEAEFDKYKAEDYWKIVKTTAEMTRTDGKVYSGYAHSTFAATSVEVAAGFDVGSVTTIQVVNYINSVAKKVVIRTNTVDTVLNITGEKDTVDHYGNVGKVQINKIDMNCYNEFGNAAYVKLLEGKLVAKDGGSITVVFATNADANKVLVTKEDNAEVEQAYTTAEVIDTTNQANGGIPLTYRVDDEDVTEESIQDNVEEAVEEMAAEQVAEDPNAENYVARIGGKGYFSLKSAVDSAKPGEVIWIIKEEIALIDDIGSIIQEGPEAGQWQYGLKNEVKLSCDTTIILGSYNIVLLENGKISLNGNKLTLVGNEYATGIYNCQKLEDDEFVSTNTSAQVLVDLCYYEPDEDMRKGFYYDNSVGHWIVGSYLIGGGQSVSGGEDNPEF